MESSTTSYTVQFKKGRDGSWIDGFLIITHHNNWIWLKDSSKITIRKGAVSPEVASQIKSLKNDIFCGGDFPNVFYFCLLIYFM